MERKTTFIIIFIIAVAFCIVFAGNIYNSVQYHKYRGLCNKYTEQLDNATNENRRLAETIGKCQSIAGSIGELCDRNVSDARGIIEIAEELRNKVYELENCLGNFSQFEYYNYWDNIYGIE